jgi:hypothetical protein
MSNRIWKHAFSQLQCTVLFASYACQTRPSVDPTLLQPGFTLFHTLQMFTDGWFLHGTDRAVSLHSETGSAPVFYYYFAYRGSISFSTLFGDPTRNYGENIMWSLPKRYTFLQTRIQSCSSHTYCIDIIHWVLNDLSSKIFLPLS